MTEGQERPCDQPPRENLAEWVSWVLAYGGRFGELEVLVELAHRIEILEREFQDDGR